MMCCSNRFYIWWLARLDSIRKQLRHVGLMEDAAPSASDGWRNSRQVQGCFS
jgi:hypothetical protein